MKTCSACGISKSLDAFNKRARSRDGRQFRCRECSASLHGKYYRENSEKWRRRDREHRELVRDLIQTSFLEGSCADCGESNPVVLEWDHVRGEKVFNIGDATRLGVGLAKLKAELAKCELVCANCHRIRTVARNPDHWFNKAPSSSG